MRQVHDVIVRDRLLAGVTPMDLDRVDEALPVGDLDVASLASMLAGRLLHPSPTEHLGQSRPVSRSRPG